MGDNNREDRYRRRDYRRYEYRRRRYPGHGLGKGLSLLIIGCVLIAVGLSFGGHVGNFAWWPAHAWGFDFDRHTGNTDGDHVIRGVEVLEAALPADLETLDLKLTAASLVIKTGPVAGYRATDFAKDGIRISLNGTTLTVEEDDWQHSFRFGQDFTRPVLEIILSEGKMLETCQISVGAGSVSIDGLGTDRFGIKSGAGSIKGHAITADRAIIETGAGALEFSQTTFDDTDIETGAGHIVFEGDLGSRTKISTGAGAVDLTLAGSADEYRVDFDRGIGSVRIGSDSYNGVGNGTAGNQEAARKIKLSTGIGAVHIDFKK